MTESLPRPSATDAQEAAQACLAPAPFAPEVLAPAGSHEALSVALASGADAVYLGLSDGFNARARATAFSRAELPELVGRAHAAGAKLYLTLNTLVFEDELSEVESLVRAAIEAGVDALIVQDPAVAFIARQLAPAMRVHASTQMTISSAEGVRFAQTLGICRVVLPRELSVREIALITQRCAVETEVFVHGALCMAWSGQCLTSEALSERSANRGQCSQACRMPYSLVVDGQRRDLGDTRYLLSPQDLAAHEALPDLAAAGVHGFKIEGRYKNAAYVAAAVDTVRGVRDAVVSGRWPTERDALTQVALRAQLTFSRGASPGFLRGDDHQRLVVGATPKHRGLALGTVVELRGSHVRVEVDRERRWDDALVRAGMGVLFEGGHDPERDDAPGGPIFGVRWLPAPRAGQPRWLELMFGQPGPDLRRVRVGDAVRLTGDPELARLAQRRATQPPPARIALSLRVFGAPGEPLSVVASASPLGRSLQAIARSEQPLHAATAQGLDAALLRDKLGALGGTPFRLAQLDDAALERGLHLPVAELKRLRRQLVEELQTQLSAPAMRIEHDAPGVPVLRARLGADVEPRLGAPQLVPLCRTPEQLEAVIASGVRAGDEVELDWMELTGLGKAVERARSAGLRVTIATVRVQKPGEEGYDRRIAALAPDAVLVRHWGGVMSFAEPAARACRVLVHGDFSLNITNSLTARHVLSLGLETVTASHDLAPPQLLALLAHVPAGRVALTLHHHIPTFHNSHCVYAHLLSDGADYRTCGRPCEQHRVALRDFAGHDHPVVVDIGCRNTVFNAMAQSAAPLVPALLEQGVRRFRIELVWERGDEVERVLSAYRALLAGTVSPAQALKQACVHEQYGVTTVSLGGARGKTR